MKPKHSLYLLVCLLLTGCSGCYTAAQYPLQPGEQVRFHTEQRANEYRARSSNDAAGTNRTVTITRPCSLTTE